MKCRTLAARPSAGWLAALATPGGLYAAELTERD
jgi:hypothetical protein